MNSFFFTQFEKNESYNFRKIERIFLRKNVNQNYITSLNLKIDLFRIMKI